MKIEKLNDHQIRCTLTREDLAARHLKISELAYGSEKTKALFQDMMIQAHMDFGFEAEDIPLMIEAIPLSPEKIVLIITKVDSPDELDLRFSNFTHSDEDDTPASSHRLPGSAPSNDLSNLLEHLKQEISEKIAEDPKEAPQDPEKKQTRLFSFTDWDKAVRASQAIASFYEGASTLYRDKNDQIYHLLLHQGTHSSIDFSRIIHTMNCYLEKEACSSGTEGFCREHYKKILPARAVQTIAAMDE